MIISLSKVSFALSAQCPQSPLVHTMHRFSRSHYTNFLLSKVSLALVGTSGLEPPTSRLSGARSNLLSYEPPTGLDPCSHLFQLGRGVITRSTAFGLPWFHQCGFAFCFLDPLCALFPSLLVLVRSRRSVFRFTSVMEMMGFEPMTPCLQGRCSPN